MHIDGNNKFNGTNENRGVDIDENFYGYNDLNNDVNNDESSKKENNKKKIIVCIIILLLFLISVGVIVFFLSRDNDGNENPIEPIPSVTLSFSNLDLKVGSSENITYTVLNDNGSVLVTWSSSDERVATVSSSGTVKGVKEGKAIITASYTINGVLYKETCSVNVNKNTATQTKDTTKPKLSYTITSGKENTWVNKDVSIKVTASDNSGNVTVKYTTNCNSNCKYTTVTNGTIKISSTGSSIVRIIASDKAGNSIEKKVNVMIDKTKPTCSLDVSETGNLSAKYEDSGSGISYYGFSSSYNGTLGTSQTLNKTGTYTYYVKDKVGNTNTCSLAVKTKTQYRYQDCVSCKTCKSAGCKFYGAWNEISGSAFVSITNVSTPKSGLQRVGCVLMETENKFSCKKYERACVTYHESCDKCGGCNTWGSFSGWSDTKAIESASRKVETRSVYYD